ncbi:hypothetical protein B1R94_03880 [Mycolicibacterium litorale]|nr:hypothetical protein B1R94_03880 [Mycolicibacterium litorale]
MRTWLGAGALTVGVGAALAGAAGVAHADSADHQAARPSASKHDAGPKRASEAASINSTTVGSAKATPAARRASLTRVAPAAAVSPAPSPARLSSSTRQPLAAARRAAAAAAQTTEQTQTINTPLGAITVTATITTPDNGTSGPVSVALTAATPIGAANFALSGYQKFTTDPNSTPAVVSETSITQGSLVLPAPVAFLANAAGSFITGGLSLYTSATSFMTAIQHGDFGSAAFTFATAGFNFMNAVLVGQQTITLPLQAVGDTGEVVALHIPVGGVFAPLRPVSVTWPATSGVDGTGSVLVKFDAGNIEFAGTRFGGVAPAFLQLFGL